jgi:hypothetical protein
MKQACATDFTRKRGTSLGAMVLLLSFALVAVRGAEAAGNCFLYSAEVGYVCSQEAETPIFLAADNYERTLASRTTYGRKQHHVNVYPAPDASTTPLYNRGAGFLFVTVRGLVEANDER